MGLTPLEGNTEQEGDYKGSEILPWELAVQTTYWPPRPWGLTPGGQDPLASLKTNGTDGEAVRNLDSAHEERTHTCLLCKQSRRSRLKPTGALTAFLRPPQGRLQPEPSTYSCHFCSVEQLPILAKATDAKESMQF